MWRTSIFLCYALMILCAWWRHQMETFPCYWPLVRGIHWSPVNSPHKGQWHGDLMFSLIGAWINAWVNNREAADFRRHRTHNDVIVMWPNFLCQYHHWRRWLSCRSPFYKICNAAHRVGDCIHFYEMQFLFHTITTKPHFMGRRAWVITSHSIILVLLFIHVMFSIGQRGRGPEYINCVYCGT